MEALSRSAQDDSVLLQLIGKWGYKFYDERDLIQMCLHLVLSALFPIWIGSHASLRRPPSAAKPKKPASLGPDIDEDDEDEPIIEGLTPSDAIMFPVLAGIVLASLYFIIKWLQDPALLNKILGWYFSAMGVFGVGKLAADGLNVATTFIFPTVWSDGKETYYVDALLSQQLTGSAKAARTLVHRKFVEVKTNPFPGLLSNFKFSETSTRKLWSYRALFKKHWTFTGHVPGIFNIKSKVQLNDAIGFVIGVAAIVLYNFNGKAWWLTNLIGFGFCYGTLQLMSPTTFWTGTLVLAGLFIYDITMVFYTPLMITVATSLDVPIKLVFPGVRGGMLGLGDVVLPGIMIALALRFDLYLHYLRKQHKAKQSTKSLKPAPPPIASDSQALVKAPYAEAIGVWGEQYWTRRVGKDADPTAADGARFPKIYFKASLVGYIMGMIATLVALNVYRHGQPALLYLVPTVLISLWGTAFVRGEQTLMWNYTEDGSIEDGERKKDNDQSKESGTIESRSADFKTDENADQPTGMPTSVSTNNVMILNEQRKKKDDHTKHDYVFRFELTSPEDGGPRKAKLFDKS